jgi:hypothetical protein
MIRRAVFGRLGRRGASGETGVPVTDSGKEVTVRLRLHLTNLGLKVALVVTAAAAVGAPKKWS